jgi:hypothetical protein
MEVKSRDGLPENPRSGKFLGMEWEAIGQIRNVKVQVQM